MQELKEKILHTRTVKRKMIGTMLSALGRGLKVCRNYDRIVCEEMDSFPENFVFVIGILGSRHPLILQNRKDGLHRIYKSLSSLTKKLSMPSAISRRFSPQQMQETKVLEIRFKNVEAGWRMVTGQISSAKAYARHDLIIKGEISKAMQFLRCIERVESYLFPRSVVKRILPAQTKIPKKRWKMWIRMLYTSKKR